MESQTHRDGTSQELDRKGVKKKYRTPFKHCVFHRTLPELNYRKKTQQRSDRIAAGILNSTLLQSSSYK